MADPENSKPPRPKKGINAKIVKHAHRRRFQEYVRKKRRDKATIGYVYWNMYLRSGKGDVFELEESLFLADLGIGKNALRPARKTLVDDGWLSKGSQKVDPLTGKWGTTAWTVNTEPVAHSEGDGTAAALAGDRLADVGSAGDRSAGDTVVLHSQYASEPEASTSSSTPKGVTSPVLASEQASGFQPSKEEKATPTPSGSSEPERQNQPQSPNPEEAGVWSEMRGEYVTEEESRKELKLCFPGFQNTEPSAKEIRLMQEIIAKCDSWCMFPREAMEYARKHKEGGLVPRSVQKLWDAVCGKDVSTTNGLCAQTKEHSVETCGRCRKELAAMPCSRCHGSTYGKPVIEHEKPFCAECMKLPSYRRHSRVTMSDSLSV